MIKYPMLLSEMRHRRITIEQLAAAINRSTGCICLWLNGKREMTLNDAKLIRNVIDKNIPLEQLFFTIGQEV